MLIYFWTKEIKILLFPVEHYTTQTDIIRYYLLPNSVLLKLFFRLTHTHTHTHLRVCVRVCVQARSRVCM